MFMIPQAWLVPAKINRIIVHWTAGPGKSRPDEHDHYNLILDQDLTLNRGVSIAKNGRAIQADFRPGIDYAAHTKGTNSNALGYSMAGMRLAQESPFIPGPDPITEAQWSLMVRHLAQLCDFYEVAVSKETVMTHAEVQRNLGPKHKQNGKWDISILPWQKDLTLFNTPTKVGNLMRAEVQKILKEGRLL